jgi:TRAP-type C4-dicarboxylate transport system permease small subunit
MEMTHQSKAVNPILKRVVSFGDRLESLQMFLGGTCIVIFFCVVIIDVFSRTIAKPIISAQEIAVFAYVWTIFFGSSVCIRRGKHFNIDFIVNALPRKLKIILQIFNHLLLGIFAYLLIFPGFEFAFMGLKRVSNPSRIPLIVPIIIIPIVGIFILFFVLESFICTLAGYTVQEVSASFLEKLAGGEKK